MSAIAEPAAQAEAPKPRVYPSDPGAQFDSDVHRRVLGHLSQPTDKYGWSIPALWERLKDSVGRVGFSDHAELASVADELVAQGHAEKVGEVYRQTTQGLDALQAEVPEHAQGTPGAAVITAATQIGDEADETVPAQTTTSTPAVIEPNA